MNASSNITHSNKFSRVLFLECQGVTISLAKADEKIIADENNDELRRCVAVLEEENLHLWASPTELQRSADRSTKAVVVLRWELDNAIGDYDVLKDGKDSLLAERNVLRDQATDLESELAKVKADAAALKAKVASGEAHGVDDAAAA
jgi:chromosome segregation ATPase